MSFGTLETNFSEILIKIQNYSFTKMHLKISSAKWQPFCPGGDELTGPKLNSLSVSEPRCSARARNPPILRRRGSLKQWKWPSHDLTYIMSNCFRLICSTIPNKGGILVSPDKSPNYTSWQKKPWYHLGNSEHTSGKKKNLNLNGNLESLWILPYMLLSHWVWNLMAVGTKVTFSKAFSQNNICIYLQ